MPAPTWGERASVWWWWRVAALAWWLAGLADDHLPPVTAAPPMDPEWVVACATCREAHRAARAAND